MSFRAAAFSTFLSSLLVASLGVASVACAGTAAEADDQGAAAASESALAFDKVLPELAAKGISGTVKKLVDPRMASSDFINADENRYYLDVRFARLSQAQFEVVHAFFGGHSKVAFDAAKTYELSDFLHPAMQAVVNQTYTTSSFSGSDLWEHAPDALAGDETFEALAKNGVAIEANCYNTTSELLRMLRPGSTETHYNLYIPSRETAQGWFSDAAYSKPIAEADLAFGDVLVVMEKQDGMGGMPYVAHTALAISKELVFEKSNGSADDPFRIALRKDVVKMYERTIEEVVAYRRFGGEGTKALPRLALPTGEIAAEYKEVLLAAHPTMKTENVTLSTDFAMGSGGWTVVAQEVQPAEVVINPRTGRGVFKADRSVLARFVALAGR